MLIRGRNCSKTIEKCLRSLRRQTYPYWRALVALDAPEDNSVEVTKKILKNDGRFVLVENHVHLGLCHNMFSIISVADWYMKAQNEEVIAFLDSDDFLPKNALAIVERTYRKHPGTLITHGSYVKMSKRRKTRISRPNPKKGNIRRLPWRSSHLKTVKWKILKNMKSGWFIHKGKWLKAASDLAVMFPCIELAGLNRVRFIPNITYYWNDNVTKKKRTIQKKCERILRERRPVA